MNVLIIDRDFFRRELSPVRLDATVKGNFSRIRNDINSLGRKFLVCQQFLVDMVFKMFI
jgi:hypothetical protein